MDISLLDYIQEKFPIALRMKEFCTSCSVVGNYEPLQISELQGDVAHLPPGQDFFHAQYLCKQT